MRYAILFATLVLPAAAVAQERYPTKPVRVIAAIAAGSLTDIVLRRATPDLAAGLGQPLVIDNRPGANTVVGADACAKAAPDGYTFCVLNRDTVSVMSTATVCGTGNFANRSSVSSICFSLLTWLFIRSFTIWALVPIASPALLVNSSTRSSLAMSL